MGKVILCEEIEDGMILSQPILNKFGQTILPANAVLQAKHSNMLRTWGIRSIVVKDDSHNEEKMEIGEDVRQLVVEQLENLIRWKPENEFEEEVFQLAFLTKARSIINSARR